MTDFGEDMTYQIDAHHEWIIDDAPRRIINEREVAVVLVGEGDDAYEVYFDPITCEQIIF